MNEIILGDALDVIPKIPDNAVQACVTSPPYAMQRASLYGGIDIERYPEWMVSWMSAMRPKLMSNGSVLVVIRPHVSNGELSDYVLRTRLALRHDDWVECDELIWLKPDAPPLGHSKRPRRCWESVLWFSKSRQPFVDPFSTSVSSVRANGFAGSSRFGRSSSSPTHQGQKNPQKGKARGPDYLVANVGGIQKKIMHPAMFPIGIAAQLIRLFSRPEDLIIDPFCGSGTTCVAAKSLGRKWIGIDKNEAYVRMATQRVSDHPPSIWSG